MSATQSGLTLRDASTRQVQMNQMGNTPLVRVRQRSLLGRYNLLIVTISCVDGRGRERQLRQFGAPAGYCMDGDELTLTQVEAVDVKPSQVAIDIAAFICMMTTVKSSKSTPVIIGMGEIAITTDADVDEFYEELVQTFQRMLGRSDLEISYSLEQVTPVVRQAGQFVDFFADEPPYHRLATV